MNLTPLVKVRSRDNLVLGSNKHAENIKSTQLSKHKHVHSAHSHYVTTKRKLTTRHFAALDFLLMIPMRNETSIKETGKSNANRNELMNQDDNDEEGKLNHDYYNSQVVAQQQTMGGGDTNAVGRKLKGHNAIVIKNKHHKMSEMSADVRQWEDQLLNGNYDILLHNYSSIKLSSSDNKQALPLLSTRMFYSRQRSYPVCLFSVIKYDEKREEAKIEKLKAGDQRGLEVFYAPKRDWRGNHYQKLIKSMQHHLKVIKLIVSLRAFAPLIPGQMSSVHRLIMLSKVTVKKEVRHVKVVRMRRILHQLSLWTAILERKW
jgi:hypothetical protein